jgi:hypothetical protein
MKERRERTLDELREDLELDQAITERFKMERHPQRSVDGEYPYGELPGMWDDTEGA